MASLQRLILLSCCVLVSTRLAAEGVAQHGDVGSHLDNPGKCVLENTMHTVLAIDEQWTDRENCQRHICHKTQGGLVIEVQSCKTPDISSERCKIGTTNANKDYPKCCPRLICTGRIFRQGRRLSSKRKHSSSRLGLDPDPNNPIQRSLLPDS